MQHELEILDKQIEAISALLPQTLDNDPNRPILLVWLGNAHNRRFDLRGELSDVHKAIEYASIALNLTSDNDPGLQILLGTLGTAHNNRFKCLGEMVDLEKDIGYTRRALAVIPDGHPDLPSQLANLAVSHKDRFERLGEMNDIEQAIEYDSRAVALTSNDHPSLSDWLDKLGTSYTLRFQHFGELDDLEKAIANQTRALDLTSDNDLHLLRRLGNIGTSYSNRFKRLGGLEDLDKAIVYESRALALTPDGNPDSTIVLGNLGVFHKDRFQRLGELYDLEKAIEYESRALALTPDGHPTLSDRLANLGVSLTHRFQRVGDLDDLEQIIEYESRALALTPDDHPHLSRRLTNLAVSHKNRFRHLNNLNDLEKSIECQSRALALTPDGHPELSSRLANLGGFYSYRFERLREMDSLEKAIQFQAGALDVITEDSPEFCRRHLNHAISYVHAYEHTPNPSHLEHSLHSFRIACMSMAGAPRDKFMNARVWADHASRHSALNCIEAYQTSVDLLPQFIWLGATTNQRYEDLKLIETLAVDAATIAILCSNLPLALEWLEHARCIVWNQNLMLRSPLDQLQTLHPSLASQLRTVAQQLHSVSSQSRESHTVHFSSITSEQNAQEHRRLAKEYSGLLTHVRTLPGFEDFLKPMNVNRLVHAARNGPIAMIICHKDQCDALLVLPCQDEIKHVPLPNFNGGKAKRAYAELEVSIDSRRLRKRGVERRPMEEEEEAEEENNEFGSMLATLWYDVVKPVLDCLGFTKRLPVEELPHITWCPTGAMSFLPLHAAGDYDKPHLRVFDYVISSYTPTLTALLESTPHSLGSDSRVLAIGQPVTPGHAELPGTATELKLLKTHAKGKVGYSQLMNDQATTTAVLDAMEQHDWVHLACHAHQNVGNPTESGFFLHDGVLDLASINRRSFKGKGLAFLSACQTATGDEQLPDEAVHLASGMLMAGYTSVIATMWSVKDSDAPLVADMVYSQLMKDGKLGNGEAGKALHYAVVGLRKKVGETEFGRWVPYIHIGS